MSLFGTFLGMGISRNSLIRTLAAPAVLFLLAGCSQQPSEDRSVTTSAATIQPVAMTEQEALDVAQKAYSGYLNASNIILHEGAINPEAIKDYLSEDQYQLELMNFKKIREQGQHLEGDVKFDNLHIQEIGSISFSAYLCLDAGEARIVDLSGNSPILETERWPLIVSFTKNADDKFLITDSETWTGSNFC